MSGSTIGTIFKVTTWGESHGKALGAVIDGCPAGLSLDECCIQSQLDRRKPGASKYATQRKEVDAVEILSGVFEGKTAGTPISLIIYNTDQRPRDYGNIADSYRPSHADFCFDQKYGFRDYRGGGRSSGRETAGRVAAGAVAKRLLSELGVTVTAYTRSIGNFEIDYSRFNLIEAGNNPLLMPDPLMPEKVYPFLDALNGDSAGGVIECIVSGMPAGIGEPVFEKLDAALAKAIVSIGAVKGFEVGAGFNSAALLGSENNDGFYAENGSILKRTNNAGGILGGMSDGSDIVFRCAVKPTPSISLPQQTVNRAGENTEITIDGRHDPLIVPRAVVVAEAMACIVIADQMLINMSARMDGVKKYYGVLK